MSMQNSIYGGVPGPSWYVFDKVHLGSATELINNAVDDGIFIGRYVLVKYCEGLLENEVRTAIEELANNPYATEDNDSLDTEDKRQYFIYYRKDNSQQSYDRVVFQKIYTKKGNKITYHPICNLHAIQNIIISPEEGGGGGIDYNAANIYLNADITLAGNYDNIGNLELGQTIQAGTSLQTLLSDMLQKRLAPKVTEPSVSLTFSKSGAYEVGSEVIPTYSAILNPGGYTYGPATGITANSWQIIDTKGNNTTVAEGNLPAFIVADGEDYTITATAQYDAGAIAKDNLGTDTGTPIDNPYFNQVQIAAGSKSSTSKKVTGYRSWFVGGDSKSTLDSTTIRALTNKATSYGTIEVKAEAYAGCKRIVVAIPEAAKKTIKSVYLKSASNADILGEFKLQNSTIEVEGANGYTITKPYKVWVYQPAQLDPSEIYTITVA